jgi:hypothetical protein
MAELAPVPCSSTTGGASGGPQEMTNVATVMVFKIAV